VQTKTVIGTSVLSFIASILLLPLSSLEHTRAIRPSNLAIIYLFVSMLCDVPRARTLYSVQGSSLALAIGFSIAVVLRAILTIVESWSKVGLLSKECQTVAPESASGIFGRSLFLWLNPLLRRGHSGILSLERLLEVDEALRCTERGPARLEEVWKQGNLVCMYRLKTY
jgi:ATP-binding cassette, subfamily C (CFTR/MRP), member 1